MDLDKFKARMEKYPNGTTMPNLATQVQQMLPTPLTQDARIGPNNIGGAKHRAERGSPALADVALGLNQPMLPTSTARCWNTGTEKERPTDQPLRRSELNHLMAQEAGKPSQLSPLFVEEMMGFPKGWTASPFQSGEGNQ